MHDSAFRIGELVLQTYCNLPKARILDIGSMDVNGSLREFAKPTTQYIGVDLENGPGVDVVVKPGEKLPFDDGSFDLIIASSAFEHDPRFWETFLEMCRVAQPAGHIYVNAPSNGGVHRYPLDCWRFYPDAGLALMDYARTHEIQIDLIESFIGRRYTDSWDAWNDFVAVFRKGPSKDPMSIDFVYKRYPSYNARTWKSSDLDYETSLTEDMQLGRDLRNQITERDLKLEEAEKIRVELAADLRISQSEASQLRSAAANLEQQLQAVSSALQAQTDSLNAALSDAREKFEQFEKERAESQKLREKLTADLQLSKTEASHLRATVASLEQQVENLSGAVQAQTDAFARIQERDLGVIRTLEADLSKLRDEHQSHVDRTSAELVRLRARETELEAAVNSERAQRERNRTAMEWLRAVHIALAGRPFWWFLLPEDSRRAREYEVLRSVGLFDDFAYLARNPDVAAKRADPLRHYITYGMNEGRDRGVG